METAEDLTMLCGNLSGVLHILSAQSFTTLSAPHAVARYVTSHCVFALSAHTSFELPNGFLTSNDFHFSAFAIHTLKLYSKRFFVLSYEWWSGRWPENYFSVHNPDFPRQGVGGWNYKSHFEKHRVF